MSRKKRVLHIIQSLGNGGCENMLLRTLPLLTEEFEHHIITLHTSGELAPQFSDKGITVATIHQAGMLDFPSYQRLFTEVQQFSPDVVITYLFHADMIGRLFLQRKIAVPCIPFLRTTYNHPRYLIARIAEWLTKPLVNRYLANSEAVKNYYVNRIGVTPEKITIIPNGIDTEYFSNIQPNHQLAASLGITRDDFVIICVANFHPNKGHRFLLEAFEKLWLEFPHSKLILVGDGEERRNIELLIQSFRSKDAIKLLGQRNDVPDLLKLSNLFVLPTLFEGHSNAILEAMAAGVPVITTDIPENGSIITHKHTGWLVPIQSVSPLAQALQVLIQESDLRAMFSTQAQLAIQNQFSLKNSVHQLKKFLLAL